MTLFYVVVMVYHFLGTQYTYVRIVCMFLYTPTILVKVSASDIVIVCYMVHDYYERMSIASLCFRRHKIAHIEC